jgi:hypothetical protein
VVGQERVASAWCRSRSLAWATQHEDHRETTSSIGSGVKLALPLNRERGSAVGGGRGRSRSRTKRRIRAALDTLLGGQAPEGVVEVLVDPDVQALHRNYPGCQSAAPPTGSK